MTLKIAYNTTNGPVLVDGQGYVIGGREWGVIDSTDELAKTELDVKRLIVADPRALAASDNPDAHAAVAALAARQERLEQAQALEKAQLVESLPEETVEALPEGGDGMPAKADLVEAAVADDSVDLPEPPKKTTSSRAAAKKQEATS